MALKDFMVKSNVQMMGHQTVGGYLAGPSNFVIDPATVGDDTGTVEVKGNLQVNGTTTTVNSTTLDVADINITVAKGAANSGAADGAGLTVDGANATLIYRSTGDKWIFNKAPFYNSDALLVASDLSIATDATPDQMEKLFINSSELLEDAFKIAWSVYESDYRPNYIIGVWRGGAPVGIAVQEFLDFLGVQSDHIAIRTSSYTGINKREDNIQVYGLNYVIRKLHSEDSLLIVDDVFDTGLSVTKIIDDLKSACKKNTPEIRIATPYFKPSNNQTKLKPNYFLHETDKWLVFPHELEGLSIDEIKNHKPELHDLIDKVIASKKMTNL